MKIIFTAFSLFCITLIHGQGLKGTITDENGVPLSFATVYIENLSAGTAANDEGKYQIRLPRGNHRVRFQFLGYKTVEKTVRIGSDFIEENIQLPVEPIELKEATITSDREDAAYTIMRKAIAKAKFHTQQIDSYKTTVYLKGSGRLLKTPSLIFFRKKIEKALKEEGIDSTTAFVTESVSEITYTRPNQYDEKVISVRTIGEDNNTSPNEFVTSSFYEPEVNGAISPLSPKAFAHYRFEYLGDFSDRGALINKIRVTPRSRGDKVFEGVIYIVDGKWAIHSLDLATYIWGIRFNINQVYAPVQEDVWMPINQIFNVNGSVFGFKFEYKYLANMHDYDITLNPELKVDLTVIDDKLEKELSEEADRRINEDNMATLSELENGQEVSRKKLRKLLKEYEKMEQKELEMENDTLEDVVSVREYKVDTMAYKRDSAYWQEIRPVPLSKYEVIGYQKQDSMAIVYKAEEEEAAGDTLNLTIGGDGNNVSRRKSKSQFSIMDVLYGGDYSFNKKVYLEYKGLLGQSHYNTVDGYNAKLVFSLRNSRKQKVQWTIDPSVRYAFSREQFGYTLYNTYGWGKKKRRSTLSFGGGRDVDQLNTDDPVNLYVNDFMSTWTERNYLKIFEKDYVEATYQKDFTDKLSIGFNAQWAKRYPLENTSDWVIFGGSDNRSYTSNVPFNAEIGDTKFEVHNAFTTDLTLETRPWLKYRIRNGRKSMIDGSSPRLSLRVRSGWNGFGDSQVDYHNLELGLRHNITVGAGNEFTFNLEAGVFPGNNDMKFMDFKHFAANKTPFATLDPTASFRMLDYYAFSTNDAYASTFLHYQFRKFLASQFTLVRLTGMREALFFNSLETQSSDHYMEFGYGLNYIFRFFRLEVVSQWQDFEFQRIGFRIGVASNLDGLFGS